MRCVWTFAVYVYVVVTRWLVVVYHSAPLRTAALRLLVVTFVVTLFTAVTRLRLVGCSLRLFTVYTFYVCYAFTDVGWLIVYAR